MESKTACAGADSCSTSKSSLMISRMSRSLGEGLAVTKLPQTKIRRSCPPVAASFRMVRNRPESHRRLGDEPPKRDVNSVKSAAYTPGGSSPSIVSSGSTTETITDGLPNVRTTDAKLRSCGPPIDDVRRVYGEYPPLARARLPFSINSGDSSGTSLGRIDPDRNWDSHGHRCRRGRL